MEQTPHPTPEPDPWFVIGERPCTWCGAGIVIVRRPGRPRLYCNHTCRQRAYEHRHGFLHHRTVLPLPGQQDAEPRRGSGYEQAGAPSYGGKHHALRTSVRPDGARRETLCGLLARPIPGRWFDPGGRASCQTCAAVVAVNPLAIGISPSNELSRLRALIVEGLEQRHPSPESLVSWLADDARRAA